LIDHSADVAAVIEALLAQPTLNHRLAQAAGLAKLDGVVCARLAALAFLQNLGVPLLRAFWGAYLGMPEQMIRAGALAQAGPEIIAMREAARAAHGWIMDIYMLRRRGSLI
jgi:precorrin-6A synthase